MKFSKGQIWVETVVYTLIAFILIGLVLAFAKPKIEEAQDKATIEQSIKVLEEIEQIIRNLGGPGNQRTIFIKIGKGNLNINGEEDLISFYIEGRYLYSEPGEEINIGNILAVTEKKGKINKVTLTRDYSQNYNISYENQDEIGKLSKSSVPYKILISNTGELEGKIKINIEVIN